MSIYTEVRNDVAKITGWSANTIGDLGGTIGGAIIVFFGVGAMPLFGDIPYADTAAACVWSALYWKRARRDNG